MDFDEATTTIRPWRPGDRDDVVAFVLSIQQGEFWLAVTADDQPDVVDVERYYQQPGGEFWVAVRGGEVVATIAALVMEENTVALKKMFVRRDHRGATGLASALMDTLVAWARAAGYRTILLGTTDTMKAAHRFYEKHGFTPFEPDALPAAFPRMPVDSLFFRRDLNGVVTIRDPNPRWPLVFDQERTRILDALALYERVKRDLATREWAIVQDYADAKTDVVHDIMTRAEGRAPTLGGTDEGAP